MQGVIVHSSSNLLDTLNTFNMPHGKKIKQSNVTEADKGQNKEQANTQEVGQDLTPLDRSVQENASK